MEFKSLGPKLVGVIEALGRALDFDVAREVEASTSAWVDVVWFDKRLSPKSLGIPKRSTRHTPVLPVVGFEVEIRTGTNPKHVKGSVSNLNNLGALMGVVVIGAGVLPYVKSKSKALANSSDLEVEKVLMERVYRWVYAESQPAGRVVVMSERQVVDWARHAGVAIPSQ
jgi:hypothetical protein